MILLKVIFWTVILTVWVFGTIACGIKGAYHFEEAGSANGLHSQKEHYKQAAIWWGTCVAIASSALVSLMMWLFALA